MSGTFGIDITGNSAGAEQSLDRVGKKLDQVKTKAREATLAAKDMNAEMAKQLRTGAMAARGTAGAAGMSGMAGGIQAGGVTGYMAAAAGAAATILTIFKRFSDLAEESSRRRIGYENNIADAAQKGKDLRAASAERGLSYEETYRKTFTEGGSTAIHNARELENRGIPTEVAFAIAAKIGNGVSPEELEKRARILVRINSRGGDVKKAADDIVNRPWLTKMDDREWSAGGYRQSDEVSFAADGITGEREPKYQNDREMAEDPYLEAGRRNRLRKGRIADQDRINAGKGGADEKGEEEWRKTAMPEIHARNEALDVMNKQLSVMERLALSQDVASALLADWISPGGSFETQLIRAMRDRDRVIAGDP